MSDLSFDERQAADAAELAAIEAERAAEYDEHKFAQDRCNEKAARARVKAERRHAEQAAARFRAARAAALASVPSLVSYLDDLSPKALRAFMQEERAAQAELERVTGARWPDLSMVALVDRAIAADRKALSVFGASGRLVDSPYGRSALQISYELHHAIERDDAFKAGALLQELASAVQQCARSASAEPTAEQERRYEIMVYVPPQQRETALQALQAQGKRNDADTATHERGLINNVLLGDAAQALLEKGQAWVAYVRDRMRLDRRGDLIVTAKVDDALVKEQATVSKLK